MEKKRMCFKKKYVVLFLILFVLLFLVVGSVLVWAGSGGGRYSVSYRTDHGTTLKIVDVVANKVQTIINASSKDYFVPNKTATEWNSFSANLPANVTLGVVTCDDADFACGSDCSYQGFTYRTATVGSQCWFADDLRATVRPSGSSLTQWPQGVASSPYIDRFTCSTNVSSCNGIFYQWYGALPEGGVVGTRIGTRGMCPPGWHIPSFSEMDTFKTTVSSNGCYNSGTVRYSANCLNSYYNLNIGVIGQRLMSGSYSGSSTFSVILSSTYDAANQYHPTKFSFYGMIITPTGGISSGSGQGWDGAIARCIKGSGGGSCGDTHCNEGETQLDCHADCDISGACGDLNCEGDETCLNCSLDCADCYSCGNGVCEPALGETAAYCPVDCS